MKITSKSIKNTKRADKPNEDKYFCDTNRNIFILLDGVSRDVENGKYPNPSPAVDIVDILVDEIFNSIISYPIHEDNIFTVIFSAIQYANNQVNIYNKKRKLSFAAGAVGIIAIIFQNKLYYAYIGDCFGRVVSQNSVYIFTSCQTELISTHKKEFSAFEIREVICNNRNHPYGYGVLNGDKRALDFLQLGTIDLTNIDSVILSTDGLENFFKSCPVNILITESADELLNRALTASNTNQDDRTIIKIERGRVE